MDITPEQIRAARALLRIEQAELARRAHVSIVTIRRPEAANGAERVAPTAIAGIRQILERSGAELPQWRSSRFWGGVGQDCHA